MTGKFELDVVFAGRVILKFKQSSEMFVTLENMGRVGTGTLCCGQTGPGSVALMIACLKLRIGRGGANLPSPAVL
jgi:hypothetical protein